MSKLKKKTISSIVGIALVIVCICSIILKKATPISASQDNKVEQSVYSSVEEASLKENNDLFVKSQNTRTTILLRNYSQFTTVNPDGTIAEPDKVSESFGTALKGTASKVYHNGKLVTGGFAYSGVVKVTDSGRDSTGRSFDTYFILGENCSFDLSELKLATSLTALATLTIEYKYSDGLPVVGNILMNFNFSTATYFELNENNLFGVLGDTNAKTYGILDHDAPSGRVKIRPGEGITAGATSVTSIITNNKVENMTFWNSHSNGSLSFLNWTGVEIKPKQMAGNIEGHQNEFSTDKKKLFTGRQMVSKSPWNKLYDAFFFEILANDNLLLNPDDIKIYSVIDSNREDITTKFYKEKNNDTGNIILYPLNNDESLYNKLIEFEVYGSLDMNKIQQWWPLVDTNNNLNLSTNFSIQVNYDGISKKFSSNTDEMSFKNIKFSKMKIIAEPEVFNVYPDYTEYLKSNYKLSKIPTVNDHGTVHITYPNGNKITTPFTPNGPNEFDSQLTIPRTELPEQLNEEPGTIKDYDTSLLAINETEPYNGLTSEDYAVKIKVYNLGAKPIPQIIKKGTTFTKKASEVIQDVVILPGHTASYEYEGDMPDTSITCLTSVMVRMTDANQPDKTTLVKVPVEVIDETPPSRGLYIAANDFISRPEPFQNLTENKINKQILKQSEAVAWDVATGSSKDITLSVESTTLPLNPEHGIYKATLQAVRGTETVKKMITIDIQSNQKVNVEFVDETGEALHDKITFDKIIGTTIDLTEETEVQKVLESIQAKNYQLVKKPDNETKIPVTREESTVQYQFKGMLFVQSSPNFLNFGRKTLGIPFIKVEKAKYDKSLIVWDNRKNGGAWNLTATLKKPLTSQEDPSKILPAAIRYKVSDTETVILSENTTQPIAKRTHETKGQYNVSNEWDKNESGLLLEVPSGEVLQAGGYRATILWQVEQAP
ncbi:MucBP domain-containing protein [Enterococcus caccae]|uniref:MucBP domain-containing protein n=1 Tax=Enterococcus caccae ATCC BAA-1240 TaxID=1158612 RepID=R3WU66_9ENTE|nr:MucBP domain-containing protein [Enterococcus caccae]EOL50917.1 hypothetical protein UC7_00030 [Enterococcus caccae ATCC BAA-1240]EOT59528.1 hypothetical protein I580_02560 [Enterococcus caccae ATCC BAA-1240]